MLTPQKAIQFTLKSILPTLSISGFSQSKSEAAKKTLSTPFFLTSEKSVGPMRATIGYGITQVKNSSEIFHEVPVENYLKKVQKTVETIHCFSPKRQTEVDVPIRIFRTHYTVTFLPSEQFLEKRFSKSNESNKVYEREKDCVLSTYKFTCKHCGNHETRAFPENGFKFGTVITGCDHCNHVELVSDHLGWI